MGKLTGRSNDKSDTEGLDNPLFSSDNETISENATDKNDYSDDFEEPSSDNETSLLGDDGSEEYEKENLNTFVRGKTESDVSRVQDGFLSSSSGKIWVNIPKNTVSSDSNFTMIEYYPQSSTGMRMVNSFELTAYDSSSKAEIRHFPTNLEISINHTMEELTGLDIDSLCLYYLDEDSLQWNPVPM